MITKYVCETCGAEFDNEVECEIHEAQERIIRGAATVKDEMFFWDYDNEPLFINKAIRGKLDDVMTVQLNSCKAVGFFRELCAKYDISARGIDSDSEGGVYSYRFAGEDAWVDILEQYDIIKELLNDIGWEA